MLKKKEYIIPCGATKAFPDTFEVSSQCSAAKIIHNPGDGCQGQTYRGRLPSDFFVFLILY